MSNVPVFDEREVLLRIAQGDELAFRRLYDRYADKVYTVAFMYMKSVVRSQDITQEIFLKVWTKRTELPEVKQFQDWLFILARNLIVSALRKKNVEYSDAAAAEEEVVEEYLKPDRQLDSKEVAALVRDAIGQLPDRQRQVYKMAREDGLKRREIAAELQLSEETVREHMNKALRSIRSYLQKRLLFLLLLLLVLLQIKYK